MCGFARKGSYNHTIIECINELKTRDVADWMITYIHTIRVFGNLVAHETKPNTIPTEINHKDVVFFSFALNRFLDLYIELKNINQK